MKQFWAENWTVILVIGIMLVAFLALRTKGDQFPSTADFDLQVTAGKPSLVEFYSNT